MPEETSRPSEQKRKDPSMNAVVVQALGWALTMVAAIYITVATTVSITRLGGTFPLVAGPALIFLVTGMTGANWYALRTMSARFDAAQKEASKDEDGKQ